MQNVTTATGLGFISHFDSFWTEWDLFKYDGLHPNKKVTKTLISNCINCIAFSLKWWSLQQDPVQCFDSALFSPVYDSAGPADCNFASLTYLSIPTRITEKEMC